jgi:hypothetical protein
VAAGYDLAFRWPDDEPLPKPARRRVPVKPGYPQYLRPGGSVWVIRRIDSGLALVLRLDGATFLGERLGCTSFEWVEPIPVGSIPDVRVAGRFDPWWWKYLEVRRGRPVRWVKTGPGSTRPSQPAPPVGQPTRPRPRVIAVDVSELPEPDPAAVRGHIRTAPERQLVNRYVRWRKVELQRLVINLGTTTLVTDLYDPDLRVLIEAKPFPERPALRMALGQLLDYGRYRRRTALAGGADQLAVLPVTHRSEARVRCTMQVCTSPQATPP